MVTDTKLRCDECGRVMNRVHRNYKDHRYCATCYAREFKKRECTRCGNVARILKSHTVAICQKCEYDEPCLRCGKAKYSMGKITAYGPVCNACSVYFRNEEPCEVCGAPSKRLTKSSELGHDRRVCPRCVTINHGTCQACRRHRKLKPREDDGLLVCKKCYQLGETTCPECSELMPAGFGSRCESCYWRSVLKKRIEINCAAFNSNMMTERFKLFGQWLLARVGEKKAAQTLNRYLAFFCDIESHWDDIPDYGKLLNHFGTAKLRRSLLPISWMEEIGLIVIDQNAKKEDSERRRVAATLEKFTSNSTERKLLDSYLNHLLARLKDGKTTLRSIRLALTPAAALLSFTSSNDQTKSLPNQDDLNKFLSKKPGQRAAIHGFIRYLRNTHDIKVELPTARDANVARIRRKNLEATLLTLMQQDDKSEASKRKWLLTALPYFHGLNKNITQTVLKRGVTKFHNDGLIIYWDNFEYWVPVPSWWVNTQ